MAGGDTYDALAERLGMPGSLPLRAFLEKVITPVQAGLMLTLPGTIAEVAEKTGMGLAETNAVLQDLYHMGAVSPLDGSPNPTRFGVLPKAYGLWVWIVSNQRLDLIKDRAIFLAARDFILLEQKSVFVTEWAARSDGLLRIVPAHGAIKDLSGVLPHEDFHEILKRQSAIAAVPCACRSMAAIEGNPCDHTDERETFHCLAFGKLALWAAHAGIGEALTADEAIARCDQAEREGLLHDWLNHDGMTSVGAACSCCSHCFAHETLKEVGLPYGRRWHKSRYETYVADADSCDGCQTCLERCYFDAIEMTGSTDGRRLQSIVDVEKCMGCGLCVVGCPNQALQLSLRTCSSFNIFRLVETTLRNFG